MNTELKFRNIGKDEIQALYLALLAGGRIANDASEDEVMAILARHASHLATALQRVMTRS